MKLFDLIKDIEIIEKINVKNFEISELASDSREVFDNSLFFAIKGNNFDGNLYIKEAFNRGAKVVITDKKSEINVPQIIVSNVFDTMDKIAKVFYMPKNNKKVKLIGVVGTNGKTTTTFITKSILDCAGKKAGVIGTLGVYYDNVYVEPILTTPSLLFLYETLQNMANNNVEYCVMEVSAHAIYQKRFGSLAFECLIFTNCTQDHLDYFKTFEEYESTKMSVFNEKYCKFIVVNSDDKTGVKIINNSTAKVFSYGINNPSDVFAIDVLTSKKGLTFVMNLFDEVINISYQSIGEFNVYNCLASATCTAVLGISTENIKKGIASVKKVFGRMEYVENFKGADVYVDYAHTPDGLENLLKSLRRITKNELILVFGCGGNRDTSKRKIMGKIAGKLADFTIITSDNPRFEDPYQIISDIESGMREESLKYITIQNRKAAIGYALSKAKSGDVIVVAGKGAEEYQDVMGVKTRFLDVEEIKDTIAKIKFGGDLIWKYI